MVCLTVSWTLVENEDTESSNKTVYSCLGCFAPGPHKNLYNTLTTSHRNISWPELWVCTSVQTSCPIPHIHLQNHKNSKLCGRQLPYSSDYHKATVSFSLKYLLSFWYYNSMHTSSLVQSSSLWELTGPSDMSWGPQTPKLSGHIPWFFYSASLSPCTAAIYAPDLPPTWLITSLS